MHSEGAVRPSRSNRQLYTSYNRSNSKSYLKYSLLNNDNNHILVFTYNTAKALECVNINRVKPTYKLNFLRKINNTS